MEKDEQDRAADLGIHAPLILVIDADAALRSRLRARLETVGAEVIESPTARAVAEAPTRLAAVVLGVPHGSALTPAVATVARARPGVEVVVMLPAGERLPAGASRVVLHGDVDAVQAALAAAGLGRRRPPSAAVEIVASERNRLADAWRELCRWDPMLPAGTQPPIAAAYVQTIAEALGRPQPLGWGPDPEVEKVTEVFAMAVGDVEIAISELVCLREVLVRHLDERLPPEEEAETMSRLHMLLDRAIGVAAARLGRRLEQQAYLDPLTGLLNRRALERDLRREAGRASRYDRRFTVVVLDLIGLKAVNDREGHLAGDARLRGLADAARQALRGGDDAYRMGGDEFVLLLPETAAAGVGAIAARLREQGAPAFSWGAATFPEDGTDAVTLLELADRRLFASRTAGV